jgi:hypothetical protein
MSVRADPAAALGVATKQYVDGRGVLRGYISGMQLSYISGATFGISAGVAASSDATAMISLQALTKNSSAFFGGTGGGALDTGTVAANTWYHVYAITKTDLSLRDVVISLNASAPALPSGFTKYRRIGAIKTNASSQWTQFIQDGDYFWWLAPVTDTTAATATPTLRTLSVPPGLNVIAMIIAYVQFAGAGGTTANHWCPDFGATTPTGAGAVLITMGLASTTGVSVPLRVRTNTASQIYNVVTSANCYSLYTEGWIDNRGKDA